MQNHRGELLLFPDCSLDASEFRAEMRTDWHPRTPTTATTRDQAVEACLRELASQLPGREHRQPRAHHAGGSRRRLLGVSRVKRLYPILESIKNRKHFRSDIDDYLANLSVGFEEARRFLDLFKRERACNDGLQLPRGEPARNECFCTL